MNISQEHIILFKSFFRGRNDVYAVRWEKDGKSGYMPDYKVDWSDYKEHKAGGGSFKDYKKKEHLPFTEDTVLHHFEGRKTVGIYPLLEDNTSYFIAADFDEANWKDSVLKLHSTCQKFEIPAYIERSRSGNGGHLWIFFEENLPAEQTRKLIQYIGRIQRSGKPVTIFDYRDSRIDYFDKMFMQRNRYYKKLMK